MEMGEHKVMANNGLGRTVSNNRTYFGTQQAECHRYLKFLPTRYLIREFGQLECGSTEGCPVMGR